MSEWKECKLGDIATYVNRGIAPKYVVNDGIPVINQKCIRSGNISNEFLKYHNKEKNHSPEKKLIEGYILINSTGVGTAGRVGLFLLNDYTLADSHVSILRLNKREAVPQYVFYNLRNREDELENTAEGSTGQIELKRDGIKDLDILLPPLPQQRAIASVLSSLDDKIDLLHRQNKTLEAMAETLFRQWFVEEADEGWEEGKIPDEFDFIMGLSPPGESYNEEGIGIPMYQGNADFEFRFPKRRVFTTDPRRFAEQFDTLISVRAPVGAQNMADEKCCIGWGVAAFRYKRNNGYYTYTYFKMKSLMKEIEQFNHTGTVFGSINKANFKDLAIVIPSIELVGAFQKDIKPIDDKVIANCIQIRTLEKLRDTLLPKLMSGEVRGQL